MEVYTDSYKPNGLTATILVSGSIMGLIVQGTTAQELGVANAYASVATIPEIVSLFKRRKRDLITYAEYNGGYCGQVTIRKDTGNIQIGYAKKLTDGLGTSIAAGVAFYMETTCVI